MPERLAALLAVVLLAVVVWAIWQLYKVRNRVRLQGGNAEVSLQEGESNPVLLVFAAPDCSICKQKQHQAMEELAQELGTALSVSEIDVTSQPELAAQYGVMTVPSSVVIDTNGTVQVMNHGFASAEKLRLQLQIPAPVELSENNSQAFSAGTDQNEQSRRRTKP